MIQQTTLAILAPSGQTYTKQLYHSGVFYMLKTIEAFRNT
jgi:hypothetical protein